MNQGTFISNRVQNRPGGPGGDPMGEGEDDAPPAEARTKTEKDKDGKDKPKPVVVEKGFDPK
jgi:hypothetical protein